MTTPSDKCYLSTAITTDNPPANRCLTNQKILTLTHQFMKSTYIPHAFIWI